jgi:hypothetical protein
VLTCCLVCVMCCVGKLPRTLSPEWQALTKEYHKHNNA